MKHFVDAPVKDAEADRLSRAAFASRLGQSIRSLAGSDSLVVGLFGAWGEGKTSVLNMLHETFAGDPRFRCTFLNPWEFAVRSSSFATSSWPSPRRQASAK